MLVDIAAQGLISLTRLIVAIVVEYVLFILIKYPGNLICRLFNRVKQPSTVKAYVVGVLLWATLIPSVTAGIYWNEARKEVTYLCGNFTKGTQLHDVQTQLNTANLSSYTQNQTQKGSTIVFSSRYGSSKCEITFDNTAKVTTVKR